MNNHTAHYIQKNKSCSQPRRLVCFDTETNQRELECGGIEQTFNIATAVFHYRRGGKKNKTVQWLETDIKDELNDWILSKSHKKEKLYVISANIWFDLRVSGMLEYLKRHRWVNKILVVNGMTVIISFKKDTRHVVFINFQNYFRTSVTVMGKILGLPKLEIDFNDTTRAKLFTYCQRDTDIIYNAMLNLFKFTKEKDLGAFGYTFPSIAMNAYRHRFMTDKILVHKQKSVVKLEREGYFGARTECFKVGSFKNTPLVQVDINSMYPAVMTVNKFPIKLAYYGIKCTTDALNHFCKQGCIMAKVEIDTDEPAYPLSVNNRTCFPTGKFTTVLSTPEIEYALTHNHITKVIEYAYFWPGYMFKSYINFFFKLRQEYKKSGNLVYDSLCKYLMNSLYGKFGQKVDELIEDIDTGNDIIERYTEFHAQKRQYITTTQFFGRMTKTINKAKEGRNSIVSISAHVTAYGRMMLYKYIKKIGRENLYYSDTDCFIMLDKPELLRKIPLSETKLGYFKVEKRADGIDIYGLKDYRFAGITKIKGIRANAKKVGYNKYEQIYFPGMLSELKNGINKPYVVKSITKQLKREYNKGTLLKSGIVVPYHF